MKYLLLVFKRLLYKRTKDIYNPETETLNFKLLDEYEYSRFENYEQIEKSLKLEAEPIAKLISESARWRNLMIFWSNSRKVIIGKSTDIVLFLTLKILPKNRGSWKYGNSFN